MRSAPYLQLKSECTKTHLDKLDLGLGVGQDIPVVSRGSEQYLTHQFGVRGVRHVKGQYVGSQRSGRLQFVTRSEMS